MEVIRIECYLILILKPYTMQLCKVSCMSHKHIKYAILHVSGV